ncbi:MAG: hypothetical protein ABJA98_04925 [Acidobacteriota bacterium]
MSVITSAPAVPIALVLPASALPTVMSTLASAGALMVFDCACPPAVLTVDLALNSAGWTTRSASTTQACVSARARACYNSLSVSSARRCVS